MRQRGVIGANHVTRGMQAERGDTGVRGQSQQPLVSGHGAQHPQSPESPFLHPTSTLPLLTASSPLLHTRHVNKSVMMISSLASNVALFGRRLSTISTPILSGGNDVGVEVLVDARGRRG